MVSNVLFSIVGVCIGIAIGLGTAFSVLMAYIRDKKRKQRKSKRWNEYEVVYLNKKTYSIPDAVRGDDYNKELTIYDIRLREEFENYIRQNVQNWWDEYENERRKELAPLARTICKYVKVEPLRLNGAWSTDWYAYVKHGAFEVKIRYTQWSGNDVNMEMKITNTNITEDNNGN